jgi:hypothetical protein
MATRAKRAMSDVNALTAYTGIFTRLYKEVYAEGQAWWTNCSC